LAIYQHQLYLIGENEQGVRAYRFARFKNVELEDSPFTYPTQLEYDPERLLDKSIGIFISEDHPLDDVVVRLAPKWAAYVRTHRWHSKQQVTFSPDGSVLVTLHVRVCPEVQAWIQGFGEDAEVLKPASLRKRVARSLAAAAAKYRLRVPGVRSVRASPKAARAARARRRG
jgi:predicted DNA-binding transcriptional regulator YafY